MALSPQHYLETNVCDIMQHAQLAGMHFSSLLHGAPYTGRLNRQRGFHAESNGMVHGLRTWNLAPSACEVLGSRARCMTFRCADHFSENSTSVWNMSAIYCTVRLADTHLSYLNVKIIIVIIIIIIIIITSCLNLKRGASVWFSCVWWHTIGFRAGQSQIVTPQPKKGKK